MISTMLLVVSAPAVVAGTAAIPVNNPGTWVVTSDYPTEALRQGAEGITGFRLAIDPQGKVADCAIVSTSGSPALDEATCQQVTRRARFTPAKDAAGKAVAGSFASRVRWTLPKVMPQPVPAEYEVSFVVAADGQITDCKIIKASGAAAQAANQATPCQRQQKTKPFTDASGNAVAKLVRLRISTEVDDVK